MIAFSKESPVGYWRYLDRDCNPDYARLGGNYSLAIVPDEKPGDFLIIYLGVAVTEASHWQPEDKNLRVDLFAWSEAGARGAVASATG